ncbi:hypothetical protein AAZX31_09G175900 [Glycine max]
MNPVIPCSIGNVSIIPGFTYSTRKNNTLTRLNLSRSTVKPGSSSWRFLLPSFVASGAFPQNKRILSFHKKSRTSISATETDVAVEEPGPVADEDSGELPSNEVGVSEDSFTKSDANPDPAKARRSRPARKSEMPPVKNEDLLPGATFTGKVKSVQPFGAFVDIGAFTDGLVHISMLSDSYVKDVASVVSVGQEVKVKLIEVNTETQRISLSMRENVDTGKQRKDAPTKTEKAGPGKRNNSKPSPKKDNVTKSTKFAIGQQLVGSVKNLARSGAFISLPEGEEGFLPVSEEPDDGFDNVMGNTTLEVGQEVNVRVLRITRGQVTLTMKKEEDTAGLDSTFNQGVVHVATNPFVVAFRKNKDIASFLDDREKTQTEVQKPSTASTLEEIKGTVNQGETVLDVPDVQGEPESSKLTDDVPSAEDDISENVGTSATNGSSTAIVDDESNLVSNVSSPKTEDEKQSQTPNAMEEFAAAVLTDSDVVEPSPDKNDAITESDITSSAPAPQESAGDDVGAITENIDSDTSLSGQSDELSPEGSLTTDATEETDQVPSPESSATEVVKTSIDDPEEEAKKQTPATENENSFTSQVEDKEVAIASDKNSSLSNSDGQTGATSGESLSKATISPALVKQLREETGAGMMDCKNALSETGGDIIKAQEYLRKKGLSSADKKASRVTAEGRIGSYIHDSRIGVLVEVNCETDFVSRGEIFKELVDDIAMQVAACPQVEFLVTEDVPEEIVNKEKEIEMQKEDLLSKPEQIRSKIVEGRIRKRLEELALLEQSYIKDDKVAVKDFVKQTIATIGENIKVKRFVRFNLGEGLEKKSQDFAAEVAAQTAAKPAPILVKEEPAVADAEAKETEPKQITVAVSASLVKQLREETGAGMMDCKKALAETGGDLEKAQEYLRKKGLSSADKKSSRLAAEGRIGSYIHDSRIGVLIEVNCETDFVGRGEKFKELVDDLAMQVVACPQVQFVSIEDIPETIVNKEKELEMQREDLLSKPENIREKIVEGRISKRLGELALLEQPFIKDDSVLVKDLVKQTVAALGENIKVRRFVRFTLGETSEKETTVPA